MRPDSLGLICSCSLIVACAGCSSQTTCHSCTQLTCTAYECYHAKDITDPDALKEACDPKKCIKSVVYFYRCYARLKHEGAGPPPKWGSCIETKNTAKAIVLQELYDNDKGDYECGENKWAAVSDCPAPASGCCGVVYSAAFAGGRPQGRCFTRPCDGKKDPKSYGVPTGRDDCSE
jgi:hypothetical protein